MKKISLDKIKEFILVKKKLIIITITVVTLLATVGFAYLALNPPEDVGAAEMGDEMLQKLNVRFDTNTINELGEEIAPTVIDGQGGRNPFDSY